MRSLRTHALLGLLVVVIGSAAESTANAQAVVPLPGESDSLVAVRLLRLLQANSSTLASLFRANTTAESAMGREIRELVTAHIERYAPIDSVEPMLVKEYVRRFTGAEVRAIYAFYSSDVGRKYLLAQHELSDSTQARIAALLAPHRAHLDAATQALITKAVSP
jgi:hypothetical protein